MEEVKKIIIITPTYPRKWRLHFLKRCSRIFRRVKNIFWIVVEDGDSLDKKVQDLLASSGIPYLYLHIGPTRKWGNRQRDLALTYIREQRLEGLVYLADDDNYYDPRIFDEIRKTKRISIFPVGHLGPRGIERPILKDGRIIGWDAHWLVRKFPVDMAAFAFDAGLLQGTKGVIFDSPQKYSRHKGWGGESELLERLINSADELEILCDQCRKCYVWHDQPLFEPVKLTYYRRKVLAPLSVLMHQAVRLSRSFLSPKRN